jgi:hypothetical protein
MELEGFGRWICLSSCFRNLIFLLFIVAAFRGEDTFLTCLIADLQQAVSGGASESFT